MAKNKRQRKPRNEQLHNILVNTKPGKHKTDKRDEAKRSKNKERLDVVEEY